MENKHITLPVSDIGMQRLSFIKFQLEERRFYLDTCVWMERAYIDEQTGRLCGADIEPFFDRLIRIAQLIQKNRNSSEPLIATTSSVIEELASLAQGYSMHGRPCMPHSIESARLGLDRVRRMLDAGVLFIHEDAPEGQHADRSLAAIAVQAHEKKICFVTQDADLSIDLLKLNDSRSFSSQILVCRVDRFGFLKKRMLTEPSLVSRMDPARRAIC